MIYDFYIDKRCYNENDTYINFNIDFPLEIEDDEYFKIKLVDFSYLNNQYNISQKLQNNIISLIKTPILNTINFTNAPNTITFTNDVANDIFNENLSSIKDSTTREDDLTNFTQTLTGEEYKLIYKDPDLTAQSSILITNVFSGLFDLPLKEDYNSLIVEQLDTNNLKLLRKITFGYRYNSIGQPALPTDVTITLNIEGSQDNITYTPINYLVPIGNTATFSSGETQNRNLVVQNRELNNGIPYRFYKFTTNSSLPTNTGTLLDAFKLSVLNVEESPYNFVEVSQSPITYNRIIPDGFYNSTDYVTKINQLLLNDNIVFSLESTTNKIIITNNNTSPTYDINPIDNNGIVKLLTINNNQKHNLGTKNELNTLDRVTPFKGDTNINLVNFQKLIIATDLRFTNNTKNDLLNGNNEYDGVGNILQWINNDEIPYSYINYINHENLNYRIDDKDIKNFKLRFYNEKRQPIAIDNGLIHLQIIKEKK